MAYVRLTLLKPRPGAEAETRRLLEELDSQFAASPGLLFSFVMSHEPAQLGRVAVWETKDDANREAVSDRTLSLRSRLRFFSMETEERMMEVHSGWLPGGIADLLKADKQRTCFIEEGRQPALLAI